MSKTNSKLFKILQTRFAKILASFLIFVVLISSFAIYSFADDTSYYLTIVPISFNNFGRLTSVASFQNSRTIDLAYYDSSTQQDYRTSLNRNDYLVNDTSTLFTKTVYGVSVEYFTISVFCQYDAIYVNSVVYDQATASSGSHALLMNPFQFVCYPVTNSAIGGYNTFYFDVVVSIDELTAEAYDRGFESGLTEGYQNGFDLGYESGSSSQAIQNARDEGYNQGVADGRTMTDSQNLGSNLLGDTLNAPMKALNDFVIYESTNGFEVTLGLVVGGAISLTLFIAFLKIFAGG